MRQILKYTLLLSVVSLVFVANVKANTHEEDVLAEVHRGENESLRGFDEIAVVTTVTAPSNQFIQAADFTKQKIQNDVELSLRLANIKVISGKEAINLPSDPHLWVALYILKPENMNIYFCTIEMQFAQTVTLLNNLSSKHIAPTWYRRIYGTESSESLNSVRVGIKNMTKEFINSYLSVNSNRLGVDQSKASSNKDRDKILHLSDELIAYYKAACIEQGGCGLLQAFVGNIAAWLGFENTHHIKTYQGIKQAAAWAFAQELVGDNPQLMKISYEGNLKDGLPDPGNTEEQAGGVLSSKIMILLLPKTQTEREATLETIAKIFRKIQPEESFDKSGKLVQPQTNPLSRFFFGEKK